MTESTSDSERRAALNRRHVPAARNGEPAIALRHLEQGVRDGIITSEQLGALVASALAEPIQDREARRGLNAVTIAYWAGAIAVLFALGWFLAARWEWLGPGGVFVVSAVYAVVFAVAGRWLMGQGYRTAAAFTTLLVVATVPVITWSVLALTGHWYEVPIAPAGPRPSRPIAPPIEASTRWIPIDILTIAAALVALRRVRFAVLAAPASLGALYLALHVSPLLLGVDRLGRKEQWVALIAGLLLVACGSVLHVLRARRPAEDAGEDYARWPLIIGFGAVAIPLIDFWGRYESVVPHLTLAGAALCVALALRLRRPEFLVAGAIGFIGYLAWLAFDVFRKTLGFPIVLAGFGLSVILLTVWLQRRYPLLAKGSSMRDVAPGARH